MLSNSRSTHHGFSFHKLPHIANVGFPFGKTFVKYANAADRMLTSPEGDAKEALELNAARFSFKSLPPSPAS